MGDGTATAPGRAADPGLEIEEGEQILQIERLLEELGQRQQKPLDQVPALPEGSGEKGQHAKGKGPGGRLMPGHGEIDDRDIRPVVPERADQGEQRGDHRAANRQLAVRLVELVRKLGVLPYQIVGEAKELHFLGGDVARADVAQVVELASFLGPGEEQRVAQRGVMGLAEERRENCQREEQQQPGDVDRDRNGQRDERDQVLEAGEYAGEEPDPPHRLPAGPLQLVVDLGVLELLEIERGRVLHQLNAGAVGEQVAQQTLQQGRGTGQDFADDCDAELDSHEQKQVPVGLNV